MSRSQVLLSLHAMAALSAGELRTFPSYSPKRFLAEFPSVPFLLFSGRERLFSQALKQSPPASTHPLVPDQENYQKHSGKPRPYSKVTENLGILSLQWPASADDLHTACTWNRRDEGMQLPGRTQNTTAVQQPLLFRDHLILQFGFLCSPIKTNPHRSGVFVHSSIIITLSTSPIWTRQINMP